MIDHRLLQLVEEQLRLHDNLDWEIRNGSSWARLERDSGDGPLGYLIKIRVLEDGSHDYTEVICWKKCDDPMLATNVNVALTDMVLLKTGTPELRTIISGMASKVLR